MSKDTNKNDDLNLEEVLSPIVEKAVKDALPKEEKAETKVERKEIKVSGDTYVKTLLLMLLGKMLMESEHI